jgi:hypothetical protein
VLPGARHVIQIALFVACPFGFGLTLLRFFIGKVGIPDHFYPANVGYSEFPVRGAGQRDKDQGDR